MKIAIPDLISNSYFPAPAAVELGFFAAEGLDMSYELIFPVDVANKAMRDGEVDFVAGSAHSTLAAFPGWNGAKLVCALSRGMYWLLVMNTDLAIARGDVAALKGRHIGAAPWVELGFRRQDEAMGKDGMGEGRQVVWQDVGPTVEQGPNLGALHEAERGARAGTQQHKWVGPCLFPRMILPLLAIQPAVWS